MGPAKTLRRANPEGEEVKQWAALVCTKHRAGWEHLPQLWGLDVCRKAFVPTPGTQGCRVCPGSEGIAWLRFLIREREWRAQCFSLKEESWHLGCAPELISIFMQLLLYITVQAAESVITVINKALETTLFYHAYFSILQVGTYIQMTDSSKTICIYIRMWIKKKNHQSSSLMVISCYNTIMLCKKL